MKSQISRKEVRPKEALSAHHHSEGLKARVEAWAILRRRFKFEFPKTQKAISNAFIK